MSFNPCLLIPIYNHRHTIRAVVEHLADYQLAIFIVDDGSDEATQATLDGLAADFPLIRLFRLQENSGKGAAMMRGMREAYRAGFSHALQIDADGQHDTNDVPRFLAIARSEPDALVCGRPVYDDSVPRARLYGRYATHLWVCIETLSLSITDSMCGFRLYPLKPICALIDRVRLPERMDFDIAILVRAAWAGLPLKSVKTRVIYPENGLSHFDMWRDNVRISKLHTKLVLEMLVRLPVLLGRKFSRAKATGKHWSGLAERGGVLGLKTLFICYRLVGARTAALLLYPVVGYFFLTGRRARAASLDYLGRVHRVLGWDMPGWRNGFRHMLAFGQSGLDKLAAWQGDIGIGDVDFPNRNEIDTLAASGRGAVFIGSHLGNLEMMRALAVGEQQMVVNAVVYTDHAVRFNELLQQANVRFAVNLIQVRQFGPETAILLKEKVDRGELVVIVGDRTSPTEKTQNQACWANFLGEAAPFARGPFILASLLDCPVYLAFCLRQRKCSPYGYKIYLEPFAEKIALPRQTRLVALQDYIQRYAARLEYFCLQASEQWFNIYDFWEPKKQPDQTGRKHGSQRFNASGNTDSDDWRKAAMH